MINPLKNLQMPVPVDPDRPNGDQTPMDGTIVLSHLLRMGENIARMARAAEYVENASFSKRSADGPCPGGLVANPIDMDPVPLGQTWELARLSFFFPRSAAASSTSYFARLYVNQRSADQVIAMAEPPLVDLGNGVLTIVFPTPFILHGGDALLADVGATVANDVAFMNAWFKSVKGEPMMRVHV